MPTATALIHEGVMKGFTNAEILLANPRLNPRSIQTIAARFRKGTPYSPNYGGPPFQLPRDLHDVLVTEARARYGPLASAHQLVLQLCAIVVKDNLFDAIMDEPAPERKAA